MNPDIKHLYEIALKPSRLIIGLMSGTSLDGLDIALCNVTGNGVQTKLQLLKFETVVYTDDIKKEIRTLFAKKNIELEKLCLLHPWLALQHAAYIKECLKKWGISPSEIDLIASHGQTIFHAPARLHQNNKFGNATLQISDGDHLAVTTGIITISDFRQKNIAAGGEGAPLAVYGDYLLFNKKGEDRVLLNIGGIANFTYLPASNETAEIVCTDVGPGNTIMDALIQEQLPGKYFDENGALASEGRVNTDLLTCLKDNPFFSESFPKTTGPELFNLHYLNNAKQKTNTVSLSIADTMATLNKFSADCITSAVSICAGNKMGMKIISSGGGIYNKVLMHHLQEQLPGCSFHSTAEWGIDPNAKEAVLFAVLANECICGNSAVAVKESKGVPAVSMGKISFPG